MIHFCVFCGSTIYFSFVNPFSLLEQFFCSISLSRLINYNKCTYNCYDNDIIAITTPLIRNLLFIAPYLNHLQGKRVKNDCEI